MNMKNLLSIGLIMLFAVSLFAGCDRNPPVNPSNATDDGGMETFTIGGEDLPRFDSCAAITDSFKEARENQNSGRFYGAIADFATAPMATMAGGIAKGSMMESVSDSGSSRDFSTTNVQVEGVDEADIIKTDGDYIYALAGGELIIAKAYPPENAKIVYSEKVGDSNFNPQELFIDGDRLLLIGNEYEQITVPMYDEVGTNNMIRRQRGYSITAIKLFDISNKEDPELVRSVDFEGSYLSSRKIGKYAYFVMNSYPYYYNDDMQGEELLPVYREGEEDFKPAAGCGDVYYLDPIVASNFITVASIDMMKEDAPVEREVIVGGGQDIYSSEDNLYVTQTFYDYRIMEVAKEQITHDPIEETYVYKFKLDDGNIDYQAKGHVPGHILNQFSMDEYDNHFRIATTVGQVWNSQNPSTNNLYVLEQDEESLDVVGKLEELAPGEKIYSVRFMGKRGYIVTFKKVDPLFVIDLADPKNPTVLGKLKIPGYSDYLHPYDENHIIGIGKDTIDPAEELVENRGLDFAWYQGVKMAIFDVSDVEHPIEEYKVVIGDRGTDSPVLYDHKAFLFDKEKELLVIPITLAQIPEAQKKDTEENRRSPQYGEYVFQGAYVFNVNLKSGFKLRGKVTHYDDNDVFMKSGYYFNGDRSILRSLYIEDVLYTFSNKRLQANDLDDLNTITKLEFDERIMHDDPVIIY